MPRARAHATFGSDRNGTVMPDAVLLLVASLVPVLALALFAGRASADRDD